MSILNCLPINLISEVYESPLGINSCQLLLNFYQKPADRLLRAVRVCPLEAASSALICLNPATTPRPGPREFLMDNVLHTALALIVLHMHVPRGAAQFLTSQLGWGVLVVECLTSRLKPRV